MLFVDSAHDVIRNWNVRHVLKNEAVILETTQQCGYFAFCNQRQEVPREVLDIPAQAHTTRYASILTNAGDPTAEEFARAA